MRIPVGLAERKLLNGLASEMLSPEAVAYLGQKVREHVRKQAAAPRPAPKARASEAARKATEIEQLRTLMKSGTFSQAVAAAAIETAEEQLRVLERAEPMREEKDTARVLRMLPRTAEVLRARIGGGNLGLRNPRSIIEGRNTLFGLFGGKVQLRRADQQPGERSYLIARLMPNV